MKNGNHEDLNVAQEFFYEHLTELLVLMNDLKGMIDFEELEQVVAFKLRHLKDEKFANLEEPLAYVYRIVRNNGIDLLRKTLSRTGNGRQVSFSDYKHAWPPDKPGTNPEETMVAKLHFEEVWRRCNEEDRQLLEYIFDQVPNEEIAEELGISPVAVRKRKSRLFKKLRERNPP